MRVPQGTPLFQIGQDDLADLERLLPEIALSIPGQMDARLRARFRRCQTILSQVRWNYGPPDRVELVPVTDGPGVPYDPRTNTTYESQEDEEDSE